MVRDNDYSGCLKTVTGCKKYSVINKLKYYSDYGNSSDKSRN